MGVYTRKDSPFWWISYQSASGERLREPTKIENTEENKKLAEKFWKKKQGEQWAQKRENIKPPRYWEEAVNEYLDYLEKTNASINTIENIKSVFRVLDPYFKGKALHTFTKLFIENTVKKMEDKFLTEKKRSYSPDTINVFLTKIRTIFRKAKNEWEWIDNDVPIKLRKTTRRERSITPEAISVLLEKVPAHQRDPILFTLCLNGLRKSNVARHEKNWIDLEHGITTIPGKYFKNGKPHTVILNQLAIEIIKRNWDNDPIYLFPYKELNTKAFRKALKKAGIENFRWHDFRHTWATWAAMNGATLLEIMQGGGWSDFRSVTRYSHLTHDSLRILGTKIHDTKLSRLIKQEDS